MSSALGSDGGVTEDPKLTVITEHPRHKRRRRGKKRKFNRSDKTANEGDVSENNAANEMSDADENEALEKDASKSKRRIRGILIRPLDVPKAPENSTQFIMEDHTVDDHTECGLYVSFETPDPYHKVEFCEETEDSRSQDINFMYESIQNLDDSYCKRDFEAAYSTSRYEDYMKLSKQELVDILQNVDLGQKTLEEDLVTYDPCSVLEQLQHKLLGLQEENATLKEANSNLKTMCRIESNDSVSDEELSGNETRCISELKEILYNESIESTSDPSVEGNFHENEATLGDLEQSGGPNMDCGSVEWVSDHLLDHTGCKNEKAEYSSVSEKMSSVEINENV